MSTQRNPNRLVHTWYNDDESTRFALDATGHLRVMTSAKDSYVLDVLRPEWAEAMVTLAADLERLGRR